MKENAIFKAITGTEYNPETDKTTSIEIAGLVIRGSISDMSEFFNNLFVAYSYAEVMARKTGRHGIAAKFENNAKIALKIRDRF